MLSLKHLKKLTSLMKNIILACISLSLSVLLADTQVVNTFFNENNLQILTQKIYILPIFFAFVLLTIKGIYDVALYTDEFIPFKLSVLSFILSIIGLFVFFRILMLGMIILVVAAYWNRGIVRSYYPRQRKI